MFVLILRFSGLLLLATLFITCDEVTLQETDIEEAAVLDQYLNLPDQAYNYADPELPAFFNLLPNTQEDNTPANNPVTNWGATLGRVLFYDVTLSANNTISCASCHVQSAGFSDNTVLSTGFEGGETGRNSMGLSNSRFYENGHFFWDERASTLEEQVLMPIQDAVEMGLTLEELVVKVDSKEYYPVLFKKVYGDEEITTERISEALSQFVRSIVSYQSKYDEGRAQVAQPTDDFPNYTDPENLGKRVFFSPETNCSRCHTSDLFVGDEARNNGLDAVITDAGLGEVTGNDNDLGKFKVGPLRNIELTAPYMHDGRFETLEEVVEHYDSGVRNSQTLDNRLQRNGQPVRMNLSGQEKEALVAFMKTLTDYELIENEQFSSPFKNQ
jgi:cytochrome c peroxidase